jgi:hypothetical protein
MARSFSQVPSRGDFIVIRSLGLRNGAWYFSFRYLAIYKLEKAIPAYANIAIHVGMKLRLALWHQNPVFTLYVRGQAGARHCRQAQCAVAGAAIDIVFDYAGHPRMVSNKIRSSNLIPGLTLPFKSLKA